MSFIRGFIVTMLAFGIAGFVNKPSQDHFTFQYSTTPCNDNVAGIMKGSFSTYTYDGQNLVKNENNVSETTTLNQEEIKEINEVLQNEYSKGNRVYGRISGNGLCFEQVLISASEPGPVVISIYRKAKENAIISWVAKVSK